MGKGSKKMKVEVSGDIRRTLDKYVEVMHSNYSSVTGDGFRNQLSKMCGQFEKHNFDVRAYRDAIRMYDAGSKETFDEYYARFAKKVKE